MCTMSYIRIPRETQGKHQFSFKDDILTLAHYTTRL